MPGHNQRKDAYATLKRDYAAAVKSWRELTDTGRTAFSWRRIAGKVRVISKSGFDWEIL